jgi:hypothetical protein
MFWKREGDIPTYLFVLRYFLLNQRLSVFISRDNSSAVYYSTNETARNSVEFQAARNQKIFFSRAWIQTRNEPRNALAL